jgi:hypothetical protein
VAGESLEKRVQMLEQQMRPLSELPERVASLETQFLQFRTEVREEFSALRSEMRAGEALLGEIRKVEASLRREIQAGDEETRRFMRVLHEEVIARIAAIGEGGRSLTLRETYFPTGTRRRSSSKKFNTKTTW